MITIVMIIVIMLRILIVERRRGRKAATAFGPDRFWPIPLLAPSFRGDVEQKNAVQPKSQVSSFRFWFHGSRVVWGCLRV